MLVRAGRSQSSVEPSYDQFDLAHSIDIVLPMAEIAIQQIYPQFLIRCTTRPYSHHFQVIVL